MRENVLGENPQLELRPAPESVGRLHERGLVDSLLFITTNRPSHTLLLVLTRRAAPSRLVRRSPKGEGGRTGHGRESGASCPWFETRTQVGCSRPAHQ